jgi:hypothetical protein
MYTFSRSESRKIKVEKRDFDIFGRTHIGAQVGSHIDTIISSSSPE